MLHLPPHHQARQNPATAVNPLAKLRSHAIKITRAEQLKQGGMPTVFQLYHAVFQTNPPWAFIVHKARQRAQLVTVQHHRAISHHQVARAH